MALEKDNPAAMNEAFRVLVIDSDPRRMRAIVEACKGEGILVIPVATITQAVNFLKCTGNVDVVLAETYLEDESVFEFLTKFKNMPEHRNVPVMLTATEPGDVGKMCLPVVQHTAKVLGAQRVIYMPIFDVSFLVHEIQIILPARKSVANPVQLGRNDYECGEISA